jgi:hypothetical protein
MGLYCGHQILAVVVASTMVGDLLVKTGRNFASF